ncbi:uncharacterized protein LOC119687219 [Teleopsis dalmanni]|uniref:uncharacterized protein LOC119687219 n=1 Tax=Teleopsis dalmanni TaxID=139649 RepID=UPI0018CF7055|nr:uncharacterized protein LOC119687219 [Teleopsis dalmanni]
MLSLGDYKDIANAMLIHLVMEKVDEDSQVKWEESVDYRKLSTWNECSAVLTRRCENRDAREHKVNQVNSKAINYQREYRNNRNYSTSLAVTKPLCEVCNGSGHDITDCSKFRKLSLKEPFNVARRIKVCFICLKRGHLQKECSAVKCSKCDLSNHQLLHEDYILESSEQRCKNWPSTSTHKTAQLSVTNVMTENEVFLATAVVMVADKFGKYHQMRAILDSGSQIAEKHKVNIDISIDISKDIPTLESMLENLSEIDDNIEAKPTGNTNTMAQTPVEFLNTATKILPEFDGKSSELHSRSTTGGQH